MPKPNPLAIRARLARLQIGGGDEMNMPDIVIPFKGSTGLVFFALREFLKQGYQPSIFELALATGHTSGTILRAIHEMEEAKIIDVTRPGPRKKNRYRILIDEV